MRNRVRMWTIVFVRGRLALFVGGCPHMGAVVFIHGCSSLYVRGCFHTCAFVFKRTQVNKVVGVDVLWSSRTMVVVVVVVVWSSWTHLGWGRRGRTLIGVMVVVASMDGVVVVVVVVVVVMATVVVVGHVVVLVRCRCWAMGVVVVSRVTEGGGQNSPMMVTTACVVTI